MPSAASEPPPVRPILLVVGPSKRRILILRIVRETTTIAVRASGAHDAFLELPGWTTDDSIHIDCRVLAGRLPRGSVWRRFALPGGRAGQRDIDAGSR